MEKFCLKWNDFQDNIATSYRKLRDDSDFSDVTLVCEENKQIEAHRVILSACSPFFSSVLKGNKHSHPMIYMRGLKSKDLVAIVDFIYHGEANIYQEDLDDFLALAEELQLKGLTGPNEDQSKEDKTESKDNVKLSKPKKQPSKEPESPSNHYETNNGIEIFNNPMTASYGGKSIVPVESGRIVVTNNEDLKLKIASMMESVTDGQNRYRCTVCGRTGKDKTHMGRHVESHIEGASHPCNLCGKVSRSSNALIMHFSNHHRK